MSEYSEVEALAESLQQNLQTNFKLVKLQTAERFSVVGSDAIAFLLVGIVGLMVLLLLSIGVSFYISTFFGNFYAGFIIVAGIYLLIGLVLFVFSKKILVKPLRDIIVRKMYGTT